MIRRPPRSTLFPTRRSSDLGAALEAEVFSIEEREDDRSAERGALPGEDPRDLEESDRKSTRLNSSHSQISYAVFCLKKKEFHPAEPTACHQALELPDAPPRW